LSAVLKILQYSLNIQTSKCKQRPQPQINSPEMGIGRRKHNLCAMHIRELVLYFQIGDCAAHLRAYIGNSGPERALYKIRHLSDV